jgi:hypothetical protein
VSPYIPEFYVGKDEGREWHAASIASQLQE